MPKLSTTVIHFSSEMYSVSFITSKRNTLLRRVKYFFGVAISIDRVGKTFRFVFVEYQYKAQRLI